MNPCNITADLLPLYVDNTCSPGSREYIEEHIKTCPKCQALLESMKEPIKVELPKQNSKKSFRSFSGSLVRRKVLVITLCVLLGLGVVGLIAFKPVISYLSETLPIPVEDIDAQVYLLSDGALYAELIYTGDEYEVVGSGSTASAGVILHESGTPDDHGMKRSSTAGSSAPGVLGSSSSSHSR